jgi:hypothetical protein
VRPSCPVRFAAGMRARDALTQLETVATNAARQSVCPLVARATDWQSTNRRVFYALIIASIISHCLLVVPGAASGALIRSCYNRIENKVIDLKESKIHIYCSITVSSSEVHGLRQLERGQNHLHTLVLRTAL